MLELPHETILAAKVKTTPTDILITCRDIHDHCFYLALPVKADRLKARDIIREAYAKEAGCSTEMIFLDAYADNKGKFWVIGPHGRFLGKATVSLADHDADKRRRAE